MSGHSELIQRMIAERRAKKYLVDLFSYGPNAARTAYILDYLEPIKPLLMLPEVTDQSKWYKGQHFYRDPDGKFIFLYEGHPGHGEHGLQHQAADEPRRHRLLLGHPGRQVEGQARLLQLRPRGLGAHAHAAALLQPRRGSQVPGTAVHRNGPDHLPRPPAGHQLAGPRQVSFVLHVPRRREGPRNRGFRSRPTRPRTSRKPAPMGSGNSSVLAQPEGRAPPQRGRGLRQLVPVPGRPVHLAAG